MRIDASNLLNGQTPAQAEDAKTRRVCQEFESLLVAQMLTKMRESVPKSDLFGSSEKEEIFRGMLDQEMAKQISETSAMKLGDLLYAQLIKERKNR
jgi:flagellar protein FlgJ